VLCATDLWARSDHALQRSLSIARELDAELSLLHVVDGGTPLRIVGRRADRARTALQWRVSQSKRSSSQPSISVRIGKPHPIIRSVARDWRADLVVLGAYRRRTGDRVLGTTAEQLAREARCAVLVVNREPQAAYSDVAFVARGPASADALVRTVSRLGLIKAESMRVSRVVYPRAQRRIASGRSHTQGPGGAVIELSRTTFDDLVLNLANEAPELLITELDRNPAISRLLGRNLANVLLRMTTSDVLIAPTAARRRSLRERLAYVLRDAA
jgi:nucleotide-binding universal stress UspA family protein